MTKRKEIANMTSIPGRTITGAEVKGWFSARKRPSDDQCTEIAKYLTKFRPQPVIKRPSGKTESERNTEAVDTLLAAIPDMLRIHKGTQWAPETREHFEIIEALRDALKRARPIIEFPFGRGHRRTSQQRPREKPWHMPSVLIGNVVSDALLKSGHIKVGLSHNSSLVKGVRGALALIGHKHIENATISAYLTRWADKNGGLGRPDTPELKEFKANFRSAGLE